MPDTHESTERIDNNLTRRQFIQRASTATAALSISGVSTKKTLGANERIGVGFIGCGDQHIAFLC